jgi:ABC-type glutathione transport system ATPase component
MAKKKEETIELKRGFDPSQYAKARFRTRIPNLDMFLYATSRLDREDVDENPEVYFNAPCGVTEGCVIGLTGISGSGKSQTAMSIASGITKPYAMNPYSGIISLQSEGGALGIDRALNLGRINPDEVHSKFMDLRDSTTHDMTVEGIKKQILKICQDRESIPKTHKIHVKSETVKSKRLTHH